MKLYYSPGACSLSPHVVLREAGFDFTIEKVDPKSKQTASGEDYLAINPLGYVPALLLDDGSVLLEGPAIVQYLADQKPELGLAPPAGSMARYTLMQWLNFISTELHKSYTLLFDRNAPGEVKTQLRAKLATRFAYLETRLAAQPFVLGQAFSVADAYLFTVLSWNRYVGIELETWPALKNYVQQIAARPSVQAALQAEGLLRK